MPPSPNAWRRAPSFNRSPTAAGARAPVSEAAEYSPMVHLPWNREASFHALLVRFSGDPRPVQRAAGAAIREVVPDSVPSPQTIQSRIDEQIAGLWRLGKMVVMLG